MNLLSFVSYHRIYEAQPSSIKSFEIWHHLGPANILGLLCLELHCDANHKSRLHGDLGRVADASNLGPNGQAGSSAAHFGSTVCNLAFEHTLLLLMG